MAADQPIPPADGALPAPPPAGFRHFVSDVAAFARWRLAGVMALAMVAAAAEGMGLVMLVPILSMAGVGGGNGDTAAVGLEWGLALYVALVAAASAVVALRGVAATSLRLGYGSHLRSRLHRALCRMEWRTFTRMAGAEATHALTVDAPQATLGVEFLLRLAGWTFEIPALLFVALHLSPALSLTALGLGALLLVLARPLNRRAHALGRQAGQASRALQADLTDDLAGMRVIRALGLEGVRHGRFEQSSRNVQAGQMAYQRSSATARAAMQALAAGLAAVAVWVAVRRLGMPLTETLVLMVTFARLLAASLRIQDAWRQVLHALPAHAAVHGLLQRCLQAAEPLDASADIPPLTREIRLENVCYRHCGDAAPALSGLGIRIPAGAVTAVVGPSGAGKSTLAELLLGLTEADEGTVLVDGVPLCGVTRKAWNRAVGYVPQDAFLFHDTIRANLTMAAPHGDEGALWAALDLAAASDFVRALPAGLETRVGDRGTLLSGGQRQRLALARALAGNPKLLILDEATSALDRENEDRILETLEALRHRLTIVVIAHRPSTVALADHVVVLDHGRAVAEGDWSQVNGLAEPLLTRLAMH